MFCLTEYSSFLEWRLRFAPLNSSNILNNSFPSHEDTCLLDSLTCLFNSSQLLFPYSQAYQPSNPCYFNILLSAQEVGIYHSLTSTRPTGTCSLCMNGGELQYLGISSFLLHKTNDEFLARPHPSIPAISSWKDSQVIKANLLVSAESLYQDAIGALYFELFQVLFTLPWSF